MSANLTFSDISTRCANQLRIPTTNATEVAKINALINEVYRDFYATQDWWFLIKRGVINTVEPYQTDTAAVTNGSISVTLLTAPAVGLGSFTGRVFMVIGDTVDANAIYRISDHTAGSSAFVLDAPFTGADNATAGFRIWKDSYDLPTDVGKLIKPKGYGKEWPIEPIGAAAMDDLKTRDQSVGRPRVITVQDYSTSGDQSTPRQLIVHPFPDKTYRIEFRYKQTLNTEMSGTNQPLIPDEYRHILTYGTLSRAYPILLADTERGLYFQNMFNDMMKLIMGIHREYNQDRPQLAPLDTDRRMGSQRRGRGSLGDWFDILPRDIG